MTATVAQQIEAALGAPVTAATLTVFDPAKNAHVERQVPWDQLRARLDLEFDPATGLGGRNGFDTLDAVPAVTVWSEAQVGALVDVTDGFGHEHAFDLVILDRYPPRPA